MRILMLIVILASFFSCKKDKLEDGKEIFIGKWNWVYTNHEHQICIGLPQVEVLTPETEHRNYSMEFLEKGIVNFYENDNYLEKNRIVFSQFSGEYCNIPFDDYLRFSIYLNNDSEDFSKKMDGCISKDTLILIRGFPYYDDPNGCESYVNYFVKQ